MAPSTLNQSAHHNDSDHELAEVREQLEHLQSDYSSLQEHIRNLAELGTTAREMMKQDSLDNLLQFIADSIVQLTNANGAYLHMVHETEDYLLVVAACGKLEQQLMGNTRRRGIGLSAQAWETGQSQYTDSYNKNYNQVVVFPEELKAVAIPLSFSGTISGVAFITSSVQEDLQSQIPFLEEIAKIASLAIFYTKQAELQEKELQRIKSLSQLGNKLYQSTDRDVILNSVGEHMFNIFDIDRVSVHQESPYDGSLMMHTVHVKKDGCVQAHQPEMEKIYDNSIIYWCYKNNQSAQIDRHVEDSRESPDVHRYLRRNQIGSTMCIPVCFDEKPWGTITINKHENKCNFNESDADALQAVASQLSTALQRNSLLSKVRHQAFHDNLTSLPNRLSFEQHFSRQIRKNSQANYAVLFCDLDGFKTINDSHGHEVGDRVLNICATRMRSCVRDGDFLARMGGDEFAILVRLSDGNRSVDQLAERIVDTLADPVHTNDLRVNIGASIGISFYPEDGISFSEILNHADVAMYQAKQSGRGKILHFNKKDADDIRQKNEMRSELLSALTRNEFELWYQPQVNWATNKVTGVEALVRWNHSSGMVPPYKFIPIAEESGFIEPLGMWIMEEAISSLASGALSESSDLHMGVNIAPPQFHNPNLSSAIIALLDQYNVGSSQLKVEITESFIMDDRETVVAQLKHLRDNGVKVAIDDFGTGYSSLSYLQDLPVDVLKIDRSFVSRLNNSNYETSIAASIIALANSLGLSTIAEGVETEEQLEYIQSLGCELIQGYYYSKPVPASELRSAIVEIESQNVLAMNKTA